MNDKLQQLTDKLYNEGLSKGKQEGEAILADARKKAEEILLQANKQADEIIGKAKAEAEDYSHKIESDVKMASAQSLQATKKDIENVLIGKIAAEPVKKSLEDGAFLKEIIKEVAKKFSVENPSDLALVLPEKLQGELEPFVSGELAKALGKEVKVSFSKKIAGGLTIGPADGSYFVSLTDETFSELIGEYLRPATKKLLFG
ncbi:MAG: hypothetical protein IJ151_03120 [Bacteroidales bacterium]|nr:hypothetical protein [Bacteroidales bacterium]